MFHAIKLFFIFIHHFLFIDQQTGQVSNTKFFANVGYMIWCYLFPYAVYHGSTAPMELWLIFGAVIIGNRTLNVMLQNKAGIPADPDNTWKGVDTSSGGTAADPAPAPATPAATPDPAPAPAPTQTTVTVTTGPVVPPSEDLVD